VKYADIARRNHEAVPEFQGGLARYSPFYNEGRLHQALDYRTPAAVCPPTRPEMSISECVVQKSTLLA
jgi:hypothetical protein